MAKNTTSTASSNSNSVVSYASKPYSIGVVIKRLTEEKHITPVELGKRVGISNGNIYRLFKSRMMSIPRLFKMSEVLGENLLLMYHPNVAPLPNPLQAENAQLKTENAQLKQQVLQLKALTEENIVLKAKLEILTEVMKEK